jgi:hypothetical protein
LGTCCNAVGHLLQDAHPGAEHVLPELEGVVEGAEDEGVFRQAVGLALGRGRHGAVAVADLVAVRQVDRPLGVVRQFALGHHEAVGQDVVDPRQRRGAGQAQVAHLHRRGAVAQDAGARAVGQALQVHQHVDAGLGDELRGGGVVHAGQPHVVVQRRQQAQPLRLL